MKKTWLFGLAAALFIFGFNMGIFFVFGVVITVFSVIVAIIGSVIASIVLTAFTKKRQEKKERQAEKEVVQQQTAAQEKKMKAGEEIFKNFIKLNISIRTEGLTEDIKLKAEAIIDLLRDLIPKMEERYSGEELTWEINKVAAVHFPDLITKYVLLNNKGRTENEEQLVKSLTAMQQEISEITEIVNKDMTGEFSRKAKMVQLKFGQGPA